MKQITEISGVVFRAAIKAEGEEAIAAATGLSGDRLARVQEALPLFKERADSVRIVRVYAKGEAPKNAQEAGEFAYIAEFFVAGAGKQNAAPGGKGGKGRRMPKPGEKPMTEAQDGEPLRGSFSMDLVALDRKRKLAAGGGPDRGGRKPGGRGGRPGGRGPGGPGGDNRGPGGAPRGPGAPGGPGGERPAGDRGPRGPGGEQRAGERPGGRGPGGPGGDRPRGPGGDRPNGPGGRGPRGPGPGGRTPRNPNGPTIEMTQRPVAGGVPHTMAAPAAVTPAVAAPAPEKV